MCGVSWINRDIYRIENIFLTIYYQVQYFLSSDSGKPRTAPKVAMKAATVSKSLMVDIDWRSQCPRRRPKNFIFPMVMQAFLSYRAKQHCLESQGSSEWSRVECLLIKYDSFLEGKQGSWDGFLRNNCFLISIQGLGKIKRTLFFRFGHIILFFTLVLNLLFHMFENQNAK